MSDSEAGEGIPLIESPPGSPAPNGGKRKRDNEEKKKKAAKRRKLKKPRDVDDEDLDAGAGINRAIGRMDSTLLSDHIAQRSKRFQPDLSVVELEDQSLPEKAILDTSTWEQERDLEHLPEFLEKFSSTSKKKQNLAQAPKAKGSPHTLVVAASGIRAADLTRALRKFQTKDALVAKLFAKHIKLKEAIEQTKQARMSMGVGTPQRITDLLNDGALSAAHLQRIVIDASHIDQKKRGILDMKETQVPLLRLLTRDEFKSRYGAEEKKIEVAFY